MAFVIDIANIKSIASRAIKRLVTLIVILKRLFYKLELYSTVQFAFNQKQKQSLCKLEGVIESRQAVHKCRSNSQNLQKNKQGSKTNLLAYMALYLLLFP